MIYVTQNLRLRREALAPLPFGQQFRREGIGVIEAFDIAARAWIAVPEPCPADLRGSLEAKGSQAKLAELVMGIQPSEARTDRHYVDQGRYITFSDFCAVGHWFVSSFARSKPYLLAACRQSTGFIPARWHSNRNGLPGKEPWQHSQRVKRGGGRGQGQWLDHAAARHPKTNSTAMRAARGNWAGRCGP